MSRRYALVAGGGTAGHLVPALAVARALEAARGTGSVELVGSRRGLDATVLGESGLAFTLLPGRGIVRRLDAAAVRANLRAGAGLGLALVLALGLVVRRRPAVVVGVGGYAAVPAALAAVALGIPVVVVNVDAVPGAANRLLGRLARASAVAYPATKLPRAVVTGAPVREEVVRAGEEPDPDRARRALGLSGAGGAGGSGGAGGAGGSGGSGGATVVVAFGGSLGARRVNEAVLDLARRWRSRTGTVLYHVVGERDSAWASAEAAALELPDGGLEYVQVPFERRMALLYQAADVVVCRAGAMTVAELAVAGVPAVVVPLPGAPGDHQGANARMLEASGAAVVIADDRCSGAALDEVLDPLLADGGARRAMASAARRLGRPHAAGAVAAVAQAHARPRPPVQGTSSGARP